MLGSKAYVLGESSGRETLCRVTGGMKVKADRDESSPYAAMLAAQDVAARCKELGINALHIRIRATGGMEPPLAGSVLVFVETCADGTIDRQWNQNTWPRCSIGSPRSRSFRYENWENRGCHPHTVGLDPSQGWSERSSSMRNHCDHIAMEDIWFFHLRPERVVK